MLLPKVKTKLFCIRTPGSFLQSPLVVLFNWQFDNFCCPRPMREPPSSSNVRPYCIPSPVGDSCFYSFQCSCCYPNTGTVASTCVAPAGGHVRPTVVLQQFGYLQAPVSTTAAAVVAILKLQIRQHPVAVGCPRSFPLHPPLFPTIPLNCCRLSHQMPCSSVVSSVRQSYQRGRLPCNVRPR